MKDGATGSGGRRPRSLNGSRSSNAMAISSISAPMMRPKPVAGIRAGRWTHRYRRPDRSASASPARLSHLARDAAIDQLARMIARLPDRHWTSLEIRRMATKLVELLPPTDEDRENAQPSGSADPAISPRASHFLTYLALAGAVLIGLIAHGSLPSNSSATAEPASQSDPPVSPDQSR